MRYAIPGIVLLILLAVLGVGLTHDPREVPSPLIGKPAPAFNLPLLGSNEMVTQELFKGRPVMINFFASWCAECRVEHPLLLRLAQQGVEIIGVDYKDEVQDGQQWLAHHGSPYKSVISDFNGVAGLDYGVYGVPETYVIDARGIIVHKQIGAVTEEAWRETIAPLMGLKP